MNLHSMDREHLRLHGADVENDPKLAEDYAIHRAIFGRPGRMHEATLNQLIFEQKKRKAKGEKMRAGKEKVEA